MKLKVYNAESPVEKFVYLKLRENGNGSVTLEAVDEDGIPADAASILTIYADGTMARHGFLNGGLGFKLTDDSKKAIVEKAIR